MGTAGEWFRLVTFDHPNRPDSRMVHRPNRTAGREHKPLCRWYQAAAARRPALLPIPARPTALAWCGIDGRA